MKKLLLGLALTTLFAAPAFAALKVGDTAPDFSAVASLGGFKAWYRRVNGLPFETGYRHDDAYPSEPGARPSRRIEDTISDARDRHIISVIARALETHDRVLVIYGASHSIVERPALEAAFGRPERLRLGPRE